VENLWKIPSLVENSDTNTLFPQFPQGRFFRNLWKSGKLCLNAASESRIETALLKSCGKFPRSILFKAVLINCEDYL
jgi:hypothetical protein